jgi:DNA-binding NtrC family response regulator
VIDRAAILGEGQRLEIAKALGVPPVSEAPATGRSGFEEYTLSPEPFRPLVRLDDAMKQHIEKALVATRGRIEGERGAAQLLGINPHTLRARMRKLGINWAVFRN